MYLQLKNVKVMLGKRAFESGTQGCIFNGRQVRPKSQRMEEKRESGSSSRSSSLPVSHSDFTVVLQSRRHQPTETETLSILERTEADTRPRPLGIQTETRPRPKKNNSKTERK